jgi:hypothetical protein
MIDSGRANLFDLDRDPRESSDLSAREAARAPWYGQVVRGWGHCAEELYRSGRAAVKGPVVSNHAPVRSGSSAAPCLQFSVGIFST